MGKSYSKLFRSSSNSSLFKNNNTEYLEPIIPLKTSIIEGWNDYYHLLKDYWGENFIAPIHGWLKTGGFVVLDMG